MNFPISQKKKNFQPVAYCLISQNGHFFVKLVLLLVAKKKNRQTGLQLSHTHINYVYKVNVIPFVIPLLFSKYTQAYK
jgi:hypothetical protein